MTRRSLFSSFAALSLLTVVLFITPAHAQSASDKHDAVLRTVQQLFDGMRAGDSTQVRAAFVPDAQMMTVANQDGTGALRKGSLDRFVAAVGEPHEAVWDERIWDVKVRIDGPMATVWAPYAFYLGDELSHCGVNAIQLLRQSDGWKIYHIADTRQQENCEIPADVRK